MSATSYGRGLISLGRLPMRPGGDVAGEVVDVSSAVSRFKTGDRGLGHAVGLTSNEPSGSTFQA
jgi:NADPH:quinone reductase-like Zn-dependent oxidoreductase